MGLTEVRDVLADDAGKDLVEVLTELDEDLARQEAEIRERRQRLRALPEAGELPAEGPFSPELTGLLAGLPGSDSPMAAKDREILALIDTGAAPEERERLLSALRGALDGPDALRVRYGAHVDLRIPLAAIGAVRRETRTTHERTAGELDLPVASRTTLTLELTAPLTRTTLLGRRRTASVIRLHAEDPDGLVRALTRV